MVLYESTTQFQSNSRSIGLSTAEDAALADMEDGMARQELPISLVTLERPGEENPSGIVWNAH